MKAQSDTAVRSTAQRSRGTVCDSFSDGPSTPRTIHLELLRISRWMRQVGVLALTLLFTAYPLLAQMTPQLIQAFTLDRQAKPAQAVVELLELLDS